MKFDNKSIESFEKNKSEIFNLITDSFKKTYDLHFLAPKDSHKSFHKKAFVISGTTNDGDHSLSVLYSYGTLICVIDYGACLDDKEPVVIPLYYGGFVKTEYWFGEKIDVWSNDISATTLRHIRAFTGLNKPEYVELFNRFWAPIE